MEQQPVPGYKNWIKVTQTEKIFYFYNKNTKETTHLHPEVYLKHKGTPMKIEYSLETQIFIENLKTILSLCGIELEINNLKGKIDDYQGSIIALPPLDQKQLVEYIKIIIPEIQLYDTEFIKQSGLKKIIICSKLRFSGQERWAIPTYTSGFLYLNCDTQILSYFRNVFHHEFYHIIDYQIWKDKINDNPDVKWNELNQEGFQYSNIQTDQGNMVGGANMRNPEEAYKKIIGFRNNYSTASQAEDKAEIWAAIMLYPFYGVKNMKESNSQITMVYKNCVSVDEKSENSISENTDKSNSQEEKNDGESKKNQKQQQYHSFQKCDCKFYFKKYKVDQIVKLKVNYMKKFMEKHFPSTQNPDFWERVAQMRVNQYLVEKKLY